MPRHIARRLLLTFAILVAGALPLAANAAPPAGFVQEDIPRPDGNTWQGVVGATFAADGTMFAWERGGTIWRIDEDNPSAHPTPVLDISDEVGGWRDFGLLGVALDPNFLSNGRIYLLYVVDRHHLLNCSEDPSGVGEPNCGLGYSPSTDQYFNATIGRITRYTLNLGTEITTDYTSRKVLLGPTIDSGIPILHQSHGTGGLVFGTDGTLIASTGDGASYSSTDTGSASETYYAQAIQDGIIRPEENVGAYRSQMLSSYNGKLLRLDPATGAGLESNPFYNPAEPYSARSRVWALGLRNPFRIGHRPDTGSHDPADGDPGSIYVGDVGWGTWEDLQVSRFGGDNFGWPYFEGMTEHSGYASRNTPNADAPNPQFGIGGCTQEFFYFRELIQQDTLNAVQFTNSCDGSPIPSSVDTFVHTRPTIDWRHGSDNARWASYAADGSAQHPQIGQTDSMGTIVTGSPFRGNAAVGGVWYTGDDFPAEYKNTYFMADYGSQWIRNVRLNEGDMPTDVSVFDSSPGPVVGLATHPIEGRLYYATWGSILRRVMYAPGGNQLPKAVASANPSFGASPLTVQFTGDQSSDPDGTISSWSWDFGDGNTSDAANPQHTFNAGSSNPQSYTVELTVTDNGGATATTSLVVSANNTPPTATITSPADGTQYPLTGDTIYSLTANISDLEHATGDLSCEWVTILHHNDHTHEEPPDTACSTTTVISPLGCGSEIYYFRVTLQVTDPEGLSASDEVLLLPACGDPQPPDTTAPTVPGNVQATALSSTSIRINWSASSDDVGVTGYNVYRNGSTDPVRSTSNLEVIDNGLTPNSLYSYTVTAIDAAGNESLPSSAASATTPPPPAWQGTDIGSVSAAGSFTDINGTITVQASGADIWATADGFHYVYQTLDGDGSLTARVSSLTNTHPWAKAGVMIRESLAANSRHAMLIVTPSNGAAVQYRRSTGGSSAPSGSGDGTTSTPAWVRIVREGDLISGYLSADGVNWALRDSISISMPGSVHIGLATTSHNNGTLTTAVFDGISVSQVGAPPSIAITSPTNGATLSDPDVTVQYALSGDTSNVDHIHVFLDGQGQANETDLDGSIPLTGLADGPHSVELQLASDGHEVLATATVNFTVQGPDVTPPTAPTNLVSTGVTETSVSLSWGAATDDRGVAGYLIYQGGQQIGSSTTTSHTVTGLAADTDYSFTVTAYDGATPPNESGPSNTLNVRTDAPQPPDTTAPTVPGNVQATALSSTSIRISWSAASDDVGVTGYNVYRDGSTAPVRSTSNLEVTDNGLTPNTLYSYTVTAIDAAGNESLPSSAASATTPPPPAWQGTDIGSVSAAGSFTDINGTITVQASGADIWATADGFHYVYQTLEGDGSLTARVSSLANTDPWAKAGVMIRETLAANSRHAMLIVTPSNGAAFQYRTSTGGSSAPSGSGDGTTSTPAWVRIVREGNLISGYLSPDGVNWALRDSVSISMTGAVYIGLATTSHRNGTLTTAVFDGINASVAEGDDTPPTTPQNVVGTASYSATYANPVGHAVGPKPHGIEIADLNNDGIPDLITADSTGTASTGTLSVLLGTGGGNYAAAVSYPVGIYPKAVIAADFNGDGVKDLASVDQNSNSVSILVGNGDGTFGARTAYSVCNKAHELTAADFTGNGALDLAVACHGGFDISILLNNGNGTFAPAYNQLSGNSPHSVAAADFDLDGNIDLAVANHGSNDVGIMLGNGDGTFASVVTYGVDSRPHGIRAADLDGDGIPDIATANDAGNSVSVLLGSGDGGFLPALDFDVGVQPKSIAIGDLNGDGHLDLVASNTGGNYPTCCVASGGDTVSILYGDGSGMFSGREDIVVGLTPFAVKLGDLNLDGHLDIATANWDDQEAGVVLFNSTVSSQITLTWDAASDADSGVAGYRVYRDGAAEPLTETTNTSFTDSGLPADVEFQYAVTAVDRASPPNESAPSSSITVRTLP